MINMVGKRFGKLVVVKRVENKTSSSLMWLCQCDCGNFKTVNGYNLRSGKTKSCGCIWRKPKDLKGKRFGKLVVEKRDGYIIGKNGINHVAWLCKCDCGNTITVKAANLTHGYTKSCGCKVLECYQKHGDSHTRLYRIWREMRKRCNRPDLYERYAGRGIKVCDEWEDYNVFKEWSLLNGYNDSLKIDRIDNNGNYEPNNCRWTTDLVQSNNRESNKYLTYCGKTKTLAEWCRELSLNRNTIMARINRGWNTKDAFETPILNFGDNLKKYKDRRST